MQITKLDNGKYIVETLGQYESDFLDKVYEAYKEWQEKEYPVFKAVNYKDSLRNESSLFPRERD